VVALRRNRLVVAIGVIVAIALGIAVSVGSRASASQSLAARRAFAHESRSSTIRRLASTQVGTPDDTAVHLASLCWERDYNDPVGDAPIDTVHYRLSYDCQAATWRFSVTLAAPVDPSTFDSLASEIDTDADASNGCDGFDLLIAGVFDGPAQKGVVVATPSCDTSSWTSVSAATFAASGTSLSLTYKESSLGNAPRLVWNAGVVPISETALVDELPDHGVLVADKFLQQIDANDGYWLVDAAGGVHAYGNARFRGDLAGTALSQPIVGMARKSDRAGYWLLGRDGGVFTFGRAAFYGSTGALHLNQPVVAMTATTTGKGYWFVASDGGIFSFGDADFFGSTGGIHLNRPIVGMAPTPTGKGYWLVAADGGIFSFGDADFRGSTGGIHLNRPIVGMASTPSGKGYWLVAADGGVFSFGDADFFGSTGGIRLVSPIVGVTASPSGHGYRFVAADGGIFSFGDAGFFGGLGGGTPPSPIVGMG
jgi:hypothetical protein